MRISVDDGSASRFGLARVYLNGAVITGVRMADEESGIVEVVSRDRAGNIRVNGDEVASEIRRGCVRIEAIPRVAATTPAHPPATPPAPAPSPPPAPKSPFTQDSAGTRYQTGPGFRDDS